MPLCFFYSSLKGKITDETAFYSWLDEFLKTSGMSYRKDVRTENGTGNLPFLITVIVAHYIMKTIKTFSV